jgi:hypothetical protein
MSRITLTLRCGCKLPIDEAAAPADRTDAPRCVFHGEQPVVRVQAPPPRFTGVAARGPLAVKDESHG